MGSGLDLRYSTFLFGTFPVHFLGEGGSWAGWMFWEYNSLTL